MPPLRRRPCLERFVGFPGYRPGKPTNSLAAARGRLIAASIAGLVLLALVDLVSGGDAHLTRSVLDAGGAGDLADVAQRRLELSAHDFAQAAGNPLFWIVMVGIAVRRALAADRRLAPAGPARGRA